jgi:hypothetical protein
MMQQDARRGVVKLELQEPFVFAEILNYISAFAKPSYKFRFASGYQIVCVAVAVSLTV